MFHLDRIYEFTFLPHGLFSRFIVRVLDFSLPLVVWSSGLLASILGPDRDDRILLRVVDADEDDEMSLSDFLNKGRIPENDSEAADELKKRAVVSYPIPTLASYLSPRH